MVSSALTGPLWLPALLARLVAAGLLLFGPWTDEPSDLEGWDVARFQEIADLEGTPWVSEPVEYPPGSVAAIELIAAEDAVGTTRMLVVVALAADLATAVTMRAMAGSRAARAYLVLGLPLVPMGLVRWDTTVTLLAVLAASALTARPGLRPSITSWPVAGFAVLATAAAAVKVWPTLLVAAAAALGRRRSVAAMASTGGLAAAGWLLWVGDGLGPIEQVLSLRGASGWHVESTVGAVVAAVGDDPSRLELNAFRIGMVDDRVVLAGRALAVAAVVALVVVARTAGGDRDPAGRDRRATLGLVMTGGVAALLVTSPLLSPQFLIWLTPWAALVLPQADDPADVEDPGGGARSMAALTLLATIITGGVLVAFGPSDLDGVVPALLLTFRNLMLAALPVLAHRSLSARSGRTAQARPKTERNTR